MYPRNELSIEEQYLDVLKMIMEEGEDKQDRTGTGTRQLWGVRLTHDLRNGFPLMTTKKMFWKGIITELLWMMQGNTNVSYLQENGVKIWNEWADENGDLGPVYGHQWRGFGCKSASFNEDNGYKKTLPVISEGSFEEFDQLLKAERTIKENPNSRRILVSAWNPRQLSEMRLPPCHLLYQFNVARGEYLDIEVYQRSADFFLGVPFDIASYSALLSMMASVTGLKPRFLNYTFSDSHIYRNHFDAVEEQLSRRGKIKELPYLILPEGANSIIDYTSYDVSDFIIENYEHEPAIRAKISV